MKYTCVLPYAYAPYYKQFKNCCKLDNVLAIDNTDLKKNIGIMKSHNLGVKKMYEDGSDYLIVLSACLRFGVAGGLDFIEYLERERPFMAHASGEWQVEGKPVIIALGWHFTAFSKEIFDAVGIWDENFTPYGLDDVDLTMRIQKHYGKDYGLRVESCDFRHAATSHSITKANVKSSFEPRHKYFMRKWGKDCHEWQADGYDRPFNLDKPLSYCPEPNDPHSIWQNEFLAGGYNFND